MILFGVTDKKIKELESKMQELGVQEKDISEHFIRSSGKGGQKVNKTSSQVYLKHIPTGIEIKCQRERSQSLNRYIARRLLIEKIESEILHKKTEKQKKIEKIRRIISILSEKKI